MTAAHRPGFRLHLALPLVLALPLAACGQRDSVTAENESASSVAEKVAKSDIRPQPGRWESMVKIEQLEMEGVPPQAKEAMAKQMGAEHRFASCLTPEEVNRPNGSFFQGGGEDCVYKHFSMAGGKIDAEMTCGKAPHSQTMAMSGTYDSANYNLKISSKGGAQQGMPMGISMAVAARRVGECTGKDEL